MVRLHPVLFLVIAVFALGGCGATKGFSNDSPQLVAAPDRVSAMLAEAADRASKSLETLAAVEYARAPDVAVAPINNAPVELRRAVTINWIGPVEPLAKMLADRAGYSFIAIGSAPPLPVVISVDEENRPVIDILRNVGLQLGVRADLKVDSQKKLIELHYPPVTGVGPKS